MPIVVKTSTILVNTRKYFQDTLNPNPAFRNLSVAFAAKNCLRTRTGDQNPKWKQMIKLGQNATTVLSGTYTTLDIHRSRAKLVYTRVGIDNQTVTQEAFGDLAVFPATLPGWTGGWSSKADARASSGFLKKVRAVQVLVSGPTFFGELRQTLNMLRKPAGALWDGVRAYKEAVRKANADNRNRYFRKQPAKYANQLSKIASGLWLEHAFGWIPFLADLDGARDAYNSLFEVDRVVKVSAGGKDAKDKGTSRYNQLIISGSYLNSLNVQKLTEIEIIRYRGAVKAQAATTASDRLARFGFTPSEFIPTAWEILPWSFLVDYFLNIGDLLSASVTDTSNVAWVNRSRVTKVIKTNYFGLDEQVIRNTLVLPNYRIDSLTYSPGYYSWIVSSVGRSQQGVPTPTLTLTYPSSPGRLFNVAALLDQVGLQIHPQHPSKRNWRR
jgi:hypothetical protein